MKDRPPRRSRPAANRASGWTAIFTREATQSAPEALAETFAFLQANGPFPPLRGERLSYPEWLDRL